MKTIPPEGVRPFTQSEDFQLVLDYRKGNVSTPHYPNHNLVTNYQYNSFGQIERQWTPDAGEALFYYDRLGRIVVSQNAQQAEDDAFSYTLYDWLGRVTEVGQAIQSTPMTREISKGIGMNPSLDTWISLASREQITRTHYDLAHVSYGNQQENLRSRVSHTAIDMDGDSNPEHQTVFSYDIHGNVNRVIQNDLGYFDMDKVVEYRYDIISGMVKGVLFQPGQKDQFHHRYEYDEDNRLVAVFTSRDGYLWDNDACYTYYSIGPLSRVELGANRVQGVDFAYTTHGWIKGVNSDGLSPSKDMGKDGLVESSNSTNTYINGLPGLHAFIARDVFSYSLGYYGEDYASCGSKPDFLSSNRASLNPLYNGNISSMITTLANPDPSSQTFMQPQPQLTHYRYDQLNRLKQMDAFTDSSVPTDFNWEDKANSFDYAVRLQYDGNGNIRTLKRNGNAGSSATVGAMDNLTYAYNWRSPSQPADGIIDNKLYSVTDLTGDGAFPNDIDNQASGNYTYDAIGNLTSDASENITNIEWTVYGKVWKITRGTPSNEQHLEFEYDAFGNRVTKIVKPNAYLNNPAEWTYTFYVRDASGNIMAVYTKSPGTNGLVLSLAEYHIYGSSRLGVENVNLNYDNIPNGSIFTKTYGKKTFELVNHLGNVLATITDRKFSVDNGYFNSQGIWVSTPDGYSDYFLAEVRSCQDYYPFGMEMPGRSYEAGDYRFGFQAQEGDPELFEGALSFKYRIHDPRIGRFLSMDPLFRKYPWNSQYSFAENQVIRYVELEGLERAEPEAFDRARSKLADIRQQISEDPSMDKTLIPDLSLTQLTEDLSRQIDDANSGTVNELGFYCGKSALQNVAINYDPVGYVNFILDIATNGSAQWNGQGPTTNLSPDIIPGMSAAGVSPASNIFGMSIDYSTSGRSSLRKMIHAINPNTMNQPGSTHPYEMRRMMRHVGLKPAGLGNIYGHYTSKDFTRIEVATMNDFIPIVLDNYGIKKGAPSGNPDYRRFGIHYLSVHTIVPDFNGEYYIEFFDYGDIQQPITRTESQLSAGMKAYWIPKRR